MILRPMLYPEQVKDARLFRVLLRMQTSVREPLQRLIYLGFFTGWFSEYGANHDFVVSR